MFTANVGHGHAVAECGNASASAARARVPIAPPAKIAAISRRSARGSASRARPSGEEAPAGSDGYGTATSAAGSGTLPDFTGDLAALLFGQAGPVPRARSSALSGTI